MLETPKKKSAPSLVPRCGLCGKKKNLTKTECCDQWICDDEENYVPFSFAQNSCSRNHRRFTLCGFHFNENHEGDWKTCSDCLKSIEAEMYGYYGTNEYNFEKLEKAPPFQPKFCARCHKKISLAHEGHSMKGDKYYCEDCGFRI